MAHDLKETFSILRKFWMKLNLAKCTSGVCYGKFFGFMINHQGIKQIKKKKDQGRNEHGNSIKAQATSVSLWKNSYTQSNYALIQRQVYAILQNFKA